MKKNYFFIAALAIGMMSSCSNNEILEEVELPSLPDQVIDEGTTRMPIELGISDPSFSVSTRGTGTVGDLVGEATNVWNGQPLGILMVEKNTMNDATINGEYIFDDFTFRAPVGIEAGNIVMYHTTENVKYYPLTGAFDFWGYHLGTMPNEQLAPAEVVEETAIVSGEIKDYTQKTVEFNIDGTHDVMAGKAILSENDSTIIEGVTGFDAASYYDRAYSSWSARKEIKPSIQFKHLLSRLVFNVKAGEEKSGTEYYDQNPVEQHLGLDNITNQTDAAVYISEVKVLDQANNLILTFTANTAEDAIKLDSIADNSYTTFTLYDRTEFDGQVGTGGDSDINASTLTDKATLVAKAPVSLTESAQLGESMMIFPGQEQFKIQIVANQYVQTYDDPEVDGVSVNDVWGWKSQPMETTVYAPSELAQGSSAELDQNEDGDYIFAAGKSYNINITIFGFQRIEVEAALEGWIAGEDVEVNPEDDAFNQ